MNSPLVTGIAVTQLEDSQRETMELQNGQNMTTQAVMTYLRRPAGGAWELTRVVVVGHYVDAPNIQATEAWTAGAHPIKSFSWETATVSQTIRDVVAAAIREVSR